MESLFDMINVRDLLSAQDLSDPTSPLSAPDLHLMIQRLESQSLQIRSQVQSYLVSHREDFARLFSLCNDAVSQTREISDDVAAIIRLLSDRPIDAEVREVVSEMKVKKEELKVKKELLGLVGTVVALNKRLESVKEALRSGRFEFAAQGLKELKVALRIDEKDDREPLVYGLLRKEWSQCFEEIQEVLVKYMEKAVRFDGELNQVEVKYQLEVENVNRIHIQTVLEAMDVVSILEYGLAKVADLMIKYVITPFVNHGQPLSFLEELHQESAVLKIVASPDIKVVPTDASKLPDFQKIIIRTSEFEAALKELMYISSDNDNRLSNFAENVEVHFAFKKKTEILAKTRNLLLECDFSIPQEYTRDGSIWKNDETSVQSSSHVVNLLFLSERCLVSKAAKELMGLIHQTLQKRKGDKMIIQRDIGDFRLKDGRKMVKVVRHMERRAVEAPIKRIDSMDLSPDVCLSSTRVALEFYQTARDAILLYEVVVPVKLERQLNGINQVAVLLHNDCLYLSQEILGFAFEYRTDFPSSIKEHAVFVDLAPRFQLLAEEILQRQVHLVIYNLKEAIDGADGFQNTHQMQQFESAKFSMEQVVFILEKIHIIWEPLLLPSTYRKSMCTVLESVFSRIARDILLLDDIAAEETLQLQRLVHLMLENLSSLLESLPPGGQTLQEFPAQSPEDLIPSLRKIRKLSGMM
ncbi:hypothetical protein V8G54_035975 [Vigna mungo]|uniref:Centromere/kinetochore protein zw10 homolog n=1 Tax=Vigna mungo TaxID=3915 RepID=A0AAQ3RDW0_VIGMU